jgi:hypothetical protein
MIAVRPELSQARHGPPHAPLRSLPSAVCPGAATAVVHAGVWRDTSTKSFPAIA